MFAQPRPPEYVPGRLVPDYLVNLTRFLKSFCLAVWKEFANMQEIGTCVLKSEKKPPKGGRWIYVGTLTSGAETLHVYRKAE